MRRIGIFIALAFGLSVALPSNVVQPGGSFPLSWLWDGTANGAAAWAAEVGGLPVQDRGKAGPGNHYVDAEATKANRGNGKAPGQVKGGLAGYQPYEPRLLGKTRGAAILKAAKAKTALDKAPLTESGFSAMSNPGAPVVDMRYPPNNWDSTTLTPQLVVRGHDPDNHPNQGLKYGYYVFAAETGQLIADSGDWTSSTMWTVPAGKLQWGKSYLYTVEAFDNENVSPEYPVFQFSTPVPQPAMTSQLAQQARKGLEPSVGNYTVQEEDAEIDTLGPDLAVTRSYNSLDMRTQQALGRGWSSIVDSRAIDAGNTVVVTYPDGQDVAFGRQADGKFQPPSGRFATFKSITGGYELIDKDATSYKFTRDVGGGVFKISSVTDANGLALTLSYNADHTAKWMQSASGRSLYFKWATPAGGNYAHVVEVATDPVVPGNWSTAKTWQYTYDNDKLIKVCSPVTWTYCTQYEYQWLSQYPNAVHNQAPMSYWRLNEPSGASIASSGVEANSGVDGAVYNNVTLGQPAGLDGSEAKSAGFNGTSSYVQLPGKLVGEGSYQTVSMWFKTTAVNGVLFSYSDKPITDGTTPGNYTPSLYVGHDGKLRGQFWQGDARNPITSGAAVNDGNWHHVTLSGNGNTQTLYLDGYAQGTLSGNIALNANGACNVYIGAGFLGGDWPTQPWAGQYPARAAYFNGSITDVAYFNRALPQTAAYDLFNVGKWPRAALTKVVRPSGAVDALIDYDEVTGKVASVTDDDGGVWTLGKPVVGGNSKVYVGSVLGGKPSDYWRLGDPAGTTDAANEVLGGKATYVGGPTLGQAGPFPDSKAVKFNGSSSYVELSNRNVPTTGPNTISLWFNMPQGNTAGGVLYSYQEAPMNNLAAGSSWTPALYIGNDGKLRGGLWTGSVWNAMTAPTPVNDGKWHQVVLTAATTHQVLFIDGKEVATSGHTVQTTTGTRAFIGAGKWAGDWPNHNGDAGYFPGSIAEFAYHKVKLNAEQVAEQYKASTQTAPIEITKVAAGVTAIPMPVSTVELTDPTGRKLAYSYDTLKDRRLIQERDSLGKVVSFGYDVGGYNNLTLDPVRSMTEEVHDVRGNIVALTTCQDHASSKCSTVYFTYFPDATTTVLNPDARNDVLLSKRDGRSSSASDNTYVTNYTYDAKGNQTEICEPLGLKTITSYTDGATVAAADGGFAPAGLPYKVVSPSGSVETTTYFKNGDVARRIDANGKATAYTYDGLGRALTETVFTKTFPGGLVTSFTYDAVGRVLTETEQGVTNRVTGAKHTSVTVNTYNFDGQLTQQEVKDSTGGDASRVEKKSYNAKGQLESETDATNATRYFSYDIYGNMVKETEANGDVTLNTYDGEGHLLTVSASGFTGDPNNPTPAADVLLESNAYDPAGRLASKTDAMGWTTKYTYTDNGLESRVTRTDGTNTFIVEDNTYDADGNLIKEVTHNGTKVTAYTYDAADRKTTMTVDPNGVKRTTTYQYSKDDEILSETDTDAAGAVVGQRQFAFDAEGHEVSETTYKSTGIVPIGRWKLEGSQADAAGNNPLAWQGPTTSFDGSSHMRSAGPGLDSTNSFTATAWVSMAEARAYTRALALKGNRQSSFDLRYEQQHNRWIFSMQQGDADNTGATQARSTSTPALNTWTHLAAVYNADTGSMCLFVNGNLEASASNPTPMRATGSLMIGAGWWNGGTVDYWKGGVKDVQFYQRALSASEIGQIKSGTAPAADATVIRESSNLDDDGLAISSVDARGYVTDNVYDEDGKITQVTGPAVQAETGGNAPVLTRPITTLGYDTFGEVTQRRDPTGDVTVTGYDAEGRVTSTTLPNYTPPGTSTPITATTTTTYDVMGQVKTLTDPLNHTTTNHYDQLGRLSKVVAADGGITKHSYDLEDNLLSTVDPTGAKTTATYDYLERPVTRSEVERQPAAVHTTTFTYNPAGRLEQTKLPTGVITKSTYNALGERKTSTDGANNVTAYDYDGAGRLIKVTNPDGTYTTHSYDLADRELSTKDYSSSGTLLRGESKQYDADDHVLASTDPRGTTTTFVYGAFDTPVSLTEPVTATESIVTSFGYDIEGKQTRVTDGRGNKFITTYNSWGMPESSIEPATAAHPNAADRTFTVSYDAAGRAVKDTQPGGITTTNTYDAMGRLKKQAGVGAEVATIDRTFDYDLAGRMTTMSGNTLSYSDRDLLLSVTGPSGNSSYGYNPDKSLVSRVDAAGTTNYTYDTAGRLFTVDNPTTGVKETLAYDNMSQVNKIVYGTNGNSRNFTFDGLHRVTLDELKAPGGASIAKVGYDWDGNGNETSKTTTGFAGPATNTYTYDLADRLTSWQQSSGAPTTYTYDKSGNRTQNGYKAFTYDERNRLIGGGGSTYTYTPRGSMRFTVSNGVSMETQADAFGQVMRQYASATGSSSYTYDGLGRVIRPGFAYTGLGNDLATDGQGLYTREPDGELIGEKVGTDQRLAWTDLHTDVVGQFGPTSTALLGSVAYDPMGKILASNTMIGNLGFQSEWTDQLTGRVNMHNRWYNTDTGQFDTRDTVANDPLPNSINANRYQYGDGNPLTSIDPTGNKAKKKKPAANCNAKCRKESGCVGHNGCGPVYVPKRAPKAHNPVKKYKPPVRHTAKKVSNTKHKAKKVSAKAKSKGKKVTNNAKRSNTPNANCNAKCRKESGCVGHNGCGPAGPVVIKKPTAKKRTNKPKTTSPSPNCNAKCRKESGCVGHNGCGPAGPIRPVRASMRPLDGPVKAAEEKKQNCSFFSKCLFKNKGEWWSKNRAWVKGGLAFGAIATCAFFTAGVCAGATFIAAGTSILDRGKDWQEKRISTSQFATGAAYDATGAKLIPTLNTWKYVKPRSYFPLPSSMTWARKSWTMRLLYNSSYTLYGNVHQGYMDKHAPWIPNLHGVQG